MPTHPRIDCRVTKRQAQQADNRVARLAARQWGVVSHDEVNRCGLSDAAIAVRRRGARLHQLYRGVYAVGHPGVSLEGRFLAAVRASGELAVLSHFAAAALWGLVEWDGRWPAVTIPGTAPRAHPRLKVHRSLLLEPRDRRRHKGIPVTSPAWTLLDLASFLDAKKLRRVTRRAYALELVTVAELRDVLVRAGRRRGRRKLAAIVADGLVPTRSELEDAVLDLIIRGGLARPDVNVPLWLKGREVIPDFRWPSARLVAEADSRQWHDDPLAREDDAERQALLEAEGERVVRVTWRQTLVNPSQTLARLRAAGAPLSGCEA
jgi:hypothetical protein